MITLNIEDTAIKLMLVRGRQVETSASLPLEPGLVHDGIVTNPAIVGRHLSELMAANGIGEKRVLVSLSGIHAIYRVVPVPKLPGNLMAEAAKREMERVMPVSLNELYTSWQPINISDVETIICLVGLPRNTVDAMIETLRQAGLQPDAMDIKPLSVARVTDERDAIVINADSTGFDIVVMIGGIPELLRSLPYTSEAGTPEEKIDEVKEELERTISFYNSSHKGAEITNRMAAFVSGELGEQLAQTLDYRIKPLPRVLSYSDSLNISEYAANTGLALRQAKSELSPVRVSLSVTPEVFLPKPFPVMQLASWAFIALAAIVVILFGIRTVQTYLDTTMLQIRISSAENQMIARQGTATSVKQIQAQIDAANQTTATFKTPLDTAKAQRESVNDDLSTITSLLPGIVDLNSITYGTDGYFVTGTAPDESTIVDYVRALTNSAKFSQVLISGMNEAEFNKWQFTLKLE